MERIRAINRGLSKLFPDSEEPFQMVARLAKGVQDMIRCALRIATYYGIEAELEASINNSYQNMKRDELIE